MSESKPIPLEERFVTLKVFSITDGLKTICIVLMHDITEQEELNEKMKLLSKTDILTGVYNRRAFDEYLVKETNSFRRYKEPFSIIMIDIDNFKNINDSLGHNIGDNVLKEAVKVFNLHIRQVDFLFRWGGDEFVILLPKTDIEGAQIIAERIRSEIETYTFPVPTGVTVSLGVSVFQLNDEVHTLIKRADEAVYRSKNDGRNRVSVLLP